MKAIIMAAGKGTRISPQIGCIPKSTLTAKNGNCIIQNTVHMLNKFGITPLICLGFKKNIIQEKLKNEHAEFCWNPFYSVTNNIASLWFACLKWGKVTPPEDVLILSADVIWGEGLLKKLIDEQGDFLVAAEKENVKKGDYFFHTTPQGIILEYGPDLPQEKQDYANVGAIKISGHVWETFSTRLNEFMEKEDYQKYYENVVLSFIGESAYTLKTVDISGESWYEIDCFEDYERYLKD